MPEPIDHHAEAIRLSVLAHDNFDSEENNARRRAPFQMQRAQMHATLALTVEQRRSADAAEQANEIARLQAMVTAVPATVNKQIDEHLRIRDGASVGGTLRPAVAATLGIADTDGSRA